MDPLLSVQKRFVPLPCKTPLSHSILSIGLLAAHACLLMKQGDVAYKLMERERECVCVSIEEKGEKVGFGGGGGGGISDLYRCPNLAWVQDDPCQKVWTII